MRFLILLSALAASHACSHDGHLVTTDEDAWISVQTGSKVNLYYCSAADKEHPVCFTPIYFAPRPLPYAP